jgi:hypothetical protein
MIGFRRILFLDVDGVLQTPACGDFDEMEHAPLLEKVLHDNPDIGIVITSTHREGKSLRDLRCFFPPKLAERIVGATPVLPLGRANGGRQLEIDTWLRQHDGIDDYAALDDERHLFNERCHWLIPTSHYVGLDDDALQALQTWIEAGQLATMAGI